MFARGVPWWCGVDVRDEDGLGRRGMIRCKTADGFVVDFDYPGHNRDFVPLECCANYHASAYRIGDVVEALHRSAPDQPWRWHPAKLLAGSSESFAFIAVDSGETLVEKMVPVDAVRTVNEVMFTGSQILIHYFEHDFEIPNSGDLGRLASGLIDMFTGDGFLKVWNRETSTIGMKLEGGRMVYSSRRGKVMTTEDIEKIFTRMAKKYLKSSSVAVADGTVHPDMKTDQLDLMDDPITAPLSLNVVEEIFSFLTPVQRVACRKVCKLWNSVLSSISSACQVEIDISVIGYRQLATMLQGTLTESTKVLVLFGGSNIRQPPQIQHLRTVRTMLKAMNLNMQFVVLSRARVGAEDLLDNWYSADCDGLYHSKWRDVCSTLIVNSVAVWIPFADKVSIVVKKEVLNVKVEVGVEILEKWCPEVSSPRISALERKLRKRWEKNDRNDRFYLWMLLTKYQAADERFHPYDLGNFPPADTLGIPALASLRPLTVWALTGH